MRAKIYDRSFCEYVHTNDYAKQIKGITSQEKKIFLRSLEMKRDGFRYLNSYRHDIFGRNLLDRTEIL